MYHLTLVCGKQLSSNEKHHRIILGGIVHTGKAKQHIVPAQGMVLVGL